LFNKPHDLIDVSWEIDFMWKRKAIKLLFLPENIKSQSKRESVIAVLAHLASGPKISTFITRSGPQKEETMGTTTGNCYLNSKPICGNVAKNEAAR